MAISDTRVTRGDIMYTPQDIAHMFGVTRRGVYKWMKEGRLHTIKAGPKLRFVTQGQLDTFIRESQRTVYRAVSGRTLDGGAGTKDSQAEPESDYPTATELSTEFLASLGSSQPKTASPKTASKKGRRR